MKIFDRIAVAFSALFFEPTQAGRRIIRQAVSRRAARWGRACTAEPRLAADVLALGGVLALGPRDQTGAPELAPEHLAYEAGRRELALELVALMGLTPFELREQMMEEHHATQDDDRSGLA
ncbi:hypothetical protein [Albimonas pacifica]|uniref:Uncharacterized protein n=1 Tax=Albimonas pacifica TaxID=1114924 RepID=A0A1I3JKY1_9RHOB|nr:hypothetical protein [Albimonas pacifica]SFI60658.1 hypothetical protein SAMN05216258_10843 [Albimonas pacifica]